MQCRNPIGKKSIKRRIFESAGAGNNMPADPNDFYVYLLLDPRKDYLPFYIGKGTGNRAYSHFSEKFSKSTNQRRRRIIHDCKRKELKVPVMFWAIGLTSIAAYEIEEELIRRFGRFGYEKGGILMNMRSSSRPPVNGISQAKAI